MGKKRKVIFLVITLILILTILGIFISKKENVINLIVHKTDENKRLDESISEDEEAAKIVDPSTWDKEKVTATTSDDGQTVPVPVGYVASSIKEERSVNTGFVIYEGSEEVNEENAKEMQTTRNQWVWVPVKDSSRLYEIDQKTGKKKGILKNMYSTQEPTALKDYDNEKNLSENNLQGLSQEKLFEDMEIDFESTIESIERYGGFYIGRYETGDLSKDKFVVKKMNNDTGRISWYETYSRVKLIGASSNVKTNIIWGGLWQETLNWLVETKCITKEQITDPSEWGNFKNSNFEYEKVNGEISIKEEGKDVKIPTGSSEHTNANNIYDLAGNEEEWTLSGDGSDVRRYRWRKLCFGWRRI